MKRLKKLLITAALAVSAAAALTAAPLAVSADVGEPYFTVVNDDLYYKWDYDETEDVYSSANKDNDTVSSFFVIMLTDGDLSFYYKTRSQEKWDRLIITSVTGGAESTIGDFSGVMDEYEQLTVYNLSCGDEVKFTYTKNNSKSIDEDTVYVKGLRVEAAAQETDDEETDDGETNDGEPNDEETDDEETNDEEPDDGEPDDGEPDDEESDDGEPDEGELDDEETDDGEPDDEALDDEETDDGEPDDGELDDEETNDEETDDGEPDDEALDDGELDDEEPDDEESDDGEPDEGETNDGEPDDGEPNDEETDDGELDDGYGDTYSFFIGVAEENVSVIIDGKVYLTDADGIIKAEFSGEISSIEYYRAELETEENAHTLYLDGAGYYTLPEVAESVYLNQPSREDAVRVCGEDGATVRDFNFSATVRYFGGGSDAVPLSVSPDGGERYVREATLYSPKLPQSFTATVYEARPCFAAFISSADSLAAEGADGFLTAALRLNCKYNALIEGRSAADVQFVNSYLAEYLDGLSRIALYAETIQPVVYGDKTVTVAVGLFGGSEITDGCPVEKQNYVCGEDMGITLDGLVYAAEYGGIKYEISVPPTAVAAKEIEIFIEDMSAVYGDRSDADLAAYTVTGVCDGDDPCVLLFREEGDGVGDYAIGGVAQNPFYAAKVHGGVCTITPRRVEITIDSAEICVTDSYDDLCGKLGFAVTGGEVAYGGGKEDLKVGLTVTVDGERLCAENYHSLIRGGNFEISGFGENDNYDLIIISGTLTVLRAEVYLNQNLLYDRLAGRVYTGEALFGDFVWEEEWQSFIYGCGPGADGGSFALVFSDGSGKRIAQGEITAAGEYAAQVIIADTGYYVFAEGQCAEVVFAVLKKDISDSLTLNVELLGGTYAVIGSSVAPLIGCTVTSVTPEVRILRGGTSVMNLNLTGEYSVTATISDDNYCGVKIFEFTMVADVAGKINELKALAERYEDGGAVTVFGEMREIISGFTEGDSLQIQANPSYAETVRQCNLAYKQFSELAAADCETAAEIARNHLSPTVALYFCISSLAGAAFVLRRF